METPVEVLVIDDNPDVTEDELNLAGDFPCHFEIVDVRHIVDGTAESNLAKADVILVDHELAPLKGELPPTASNGLALIGVLRQHLLETDPMPLLALFTNDVHLVPSDPADPKAHMLARANAFDWAYSKRGLSPSDLASTIASLARAAATLRDAFGNYPIEQYEVLDNDIERLHLALQLPEGTAWKLAAQREIAAAQPPVFTPEEGGDPAAIRQWLLHRIMPYPTFLIGSEYAAARLGLSVGEFQEVLKSSASQHFEPAKYTGPLADFVPGRYWRAGIEQGAREIAGGFATTELREALNSAVGRELMFADHPRPVVGLDSNLKPSAAVAPSKTVRIHVDGWPSYAEPPRLLRSALESDELRNMVIDDDKEFIEGAQP